MRFILHLLLLGSTRAARRWVERGDPASALETEASAEALLSSASLYLSENVPADELKLVRNDPTIVALASQGLSLEDLFGWLALSRQQELKSADKAPSLLEIHQNPDEILGLTSDPATETDGVDPSVAAEMRAALISPHNENVDPNVVHSNIGVVHRFREWLKEREISDRPQGSMTREQYQMWRRRQATIATGFFSESNRVPDENIAKAKELLEDSLAINVELDQFLSFLDSEGDVDWVNTHRHLGLLGRGARRVGRFVGAVVHGTAELFRQTWRTFRHMMTANERRCVASQSEAEGHEARRVGLTSGDEMLNNNGGEVDDQEIERQIHRTEQVLGALEQGEEETQAGLDADVDALRHAGNRLARSASTGDATAEEVNATAAAFQSVSDHVCRSSQHSVARKMLEFLRSIRRAVGSALAIALPGYGMRGLSAQLGLAGGFEEVIDFRNREIGYFRWASLDIGASMFGASVGSYSAVGWKGYKVNWTLQDAYQTAICTPHIGSLPALPDLTAALPWAPQPSLSVTYCTDADNSQGTPWIPEPHGVNGLVFGAGFSLSSAQLLGHTGIGAVADLGTTVGETFSTDVQWAQYWMFTSECFDSLGSLLRAMYTPICASCSGAAEHARVSTLRAATHVLAFPLVTEMLHTFIAWQYDRNVRPEGYNPPCSDMSTNNRENPDNVLGAVSRSLARAAETLQKIETEIGALETQMLEAVASNEGMTESEEWNALMHEQHMCARHPLLPRTLAEADTELDQQEFEDVRAQLNERSRDELVEACHQFRSIRRCRWRSKESLVEALSVRASTYASEDEPFGLCRSDSDCPLANQECGNVNGVQQCKCVRDFFHSLCPQAHDICAPRTDAADAVRSAAQEMRAFLQTQRIDVGQYVTELQQATSSI